MAGENVIRSLGRGVAHTYARSRACAPRSAGQAPILRLGLRHSLSQGKCQRPRTFDPRVGLRDADDLALPVPPVSVPQRRSSQRAPDWASFSPTETGRASFVEARKLGLVTLAQMHARGVRKLPRLAKERGELESGRRWIIQGKRRQHAVTAVHAARQLANPRLRSPSPPLHLASPVCASKSLPLATGAQRFDRWENPPLPDRQRPPSPRPLSGPARTSRDARMGFPLHGSGGGVDVPPGFVTTLYVSRSPGPRRHEGPLGWHEREQPIPQWDPASLTPCAT